MVVVQAVPGNSGCWFSHGMGRIASNIQEPHVPVRMVGEKSLLLPTRGLESDAPNVRRSPKLPLAAGADLHEKVAV